MNPSSTFFSSFRLRLGCCLALALLWTAGTRSARAGEPGNFAEGNRRYAAGEFRRAADAYEAQVARGELSANLFYNLGDAYHRLGEKGRATLNYRRALLLEPGHGEAAANLAFVAGDKPAAAGWVGLGAWWNWLAWAAAAAGWLGVAGLFAAVAGGRRRPAALVAGGGGLLLCVVGVGTLWFFGGDRGEGTPGIILAEAAPALYSPLEGAKVVASLSAGGEVHILSEQGAWTYVLLGDGATHAWLASRNVEKLVPR